MMDVLGLDFTTAAISTFVFVILAVLLYIFSIFGVREKTYEEALEEQRKRNEASLFQSKNEKADKGGREKKFRKPWGKRGKEKHQTDKGGSELSGNESGPQHEHVAFKPETEVIPSDFDPSSLKSASKSKKNKKSSKPILVNKDEGSPKKESKIPEADEEDVSGKNRSNSFSLTKPRDEIELRHLQQVNDTTKQQSESSEVSDDNQETQQQRLKQKKVSKLEEKEILKQDLAPEIKKEVITPVQSPAKKQKKAKVDVINLTGDSVSGNHLVNLLKNSILSDAEVQQLIDILLNRQQGGNSEWTRKGDPVAALKKQLQEKEQALEDEQRLTQSANAKLKEIRTESTNEKTRFSQLERQLNLKIQNQQQEIQALHNRMCHSHEQQVAETSALQSQLQQAQSALNEDRISLQRITEENKRLKEALSIREAEASNMSAMNHLQVELEQLRSAKEQCEISNNDLRCKVEQWNKAETAYKQEEAAMKQHITDLTNKLNQAENNKQSLMQDINNLKSDSSIKDSKMSEFQDKLVKLDKVSNDLETQNNDMKSKYDQKVGECESLVTDVKSYKSQVSELTNQHNTSKIEIDKLKAQNKSLSAKIESSKDAQQNGDLNGDGHKSIAIIEHDKIVTEKDKAIARLKDELNTSLSKLNSYKADLDLQLKKNNELREKNWKIMDAMSNVEKTSSAKLNESNRAADEKLIEAVSVEQNKFKQSFQRIFPVINLDNSIKFNDWLSEFEKEALNIINQNSEQQPSSTSEEEILSLNGKLAEMEDDKSKLEKKVHNYKSSLIETETILQKLQESVNESEKVWEEKLQEQEKELKQVVEEKQALLSKISQVQASQDMQTELKNLESKLQGEELERKNLTEKYNEADKTAKGLQEKLEESKQEVKRFQKEHESLDNLTKELDGIKSQLEQEKKTNKELSAQTVKLNSLVKIGQDSLKAESAVVDKLQEQLKQYQCEKSAQDTSSTQELKNSTTPIKESIETNPQQIKKDKPSKKKRGGASKK